MYNNHIIVIKAFWREEVTGFFVKASLYVPDLSKLGTKKVHVPYMYPNMVELFNMVSII